jgi:hypothetical protein
VVESELHSELQGKGKLQSELKLDENEIVIADVVNDDLTDAMKGCYGLVVATSAKPALVWTSMPGFFWKKFVTKEEGAMPGFSFRQMPEEVYA